MSWMQNVMGFVKDNNFCSCGNYQQLPPHQTCETYHFFKCTSPIFLIGSFFPLAANMPFHQKCASENLLLCLGRTQSLTGPLSKLIWDCNSGYVLYESDTETKTTNRPYMNLRLKPRLQMGFIRVQDWDPDSLYTLFKSETETETLKSCETWDWEGDLIT